MNKLEALLKLASLAGDGEQSTSGDPFVGKPVLVRSRNAGVLFGDCTAIEGQSVTLDNARQVWWKAAKGGTVIDLATQGPIDGETKLSYAAELPVRVVESCTIQVCSSASAKLFREISSEGKWK